MLDGIVSALDGWSHAFRPFQHRAYVFQRNARRRILRLACLPGTIGSTPTPAPWPGTGGFRNVCGGDAVGAGQVGDVAGDLADAMESAGRKLELLHGNVEQAPGAVIDPTELARLHRGHVGVAGEPRSKRTTPSRRASLMSPLPSSSIRFSSASV